MEAGLRPILVAEAPPQHGKSVTIISFISWLAGQRPEYKVIYASVSERLGVRANLMLQRIYDSPKYQRIFPGTKINASKQAQRVTSKQRNRQLLEYLGDDGCFRNTTVGGSIVGESLDVGVVDDPIKGREQANSELIRNKTWDWLNDDFFTRFSEKAGTIIILTRWHIDDPVGRLKALGSRIKVLRYPALADDSAVLMPNDPRTPGSGEALFPEHKSREFILERKARMTIESFESLYQQNPFVSGGGLFKLEWWQYWEVLPKIKYRVIYGDTASKTKEKNDFSVLQCWGKSDTGKAVLIDQIRGKWESPELRVQVQAFWNKHKAVQGLGTLRGMKIEDASSGTALIQELKRPSGGSIPITGIVRTKDKVERANDVLPSVAAGLVVLPKSAPWLSDYLAELTQFDNGPHDDQVDPTVDAIGDILGGSDYSLENVS